MLWSRAGGLSERAFLTLRSNAAQVNSVFLVQLRKSLNVDFAAAEAIKFCPRDHCSPAPTQPFSRLPSLAGKNLLE